MAEEVISRIEKAKGDIQEKLRNMNLEVLEVFEALKSMPMPEPPPAAVVESSGTNETPALLAAARTINEAHSQVDLLKALVETASQFIPRVLLLIRKSGSAHGWAGKGFTDDFQNGPMKRVKWKIDDYPELTRVFHQASALTSNFNDLSDLSEQIGEFDGFVPFKSCFFPLIVKGKVAALLYGDSGSEAQLNGKDAVELLCHITGLDLSLVAAKAKVAKPKPKAPEAQEAPTAEPSFEAPVEPPAPQPSFEMPPDPPAPEPSFEMPPEPVEEDSPAIKKAKRAARVLVSDLKLYNEAAVNATNGDLYNRLRDDIDRSYQHYKERVAGLDPTPEENYFKVEIIKQLGEGDPNVIGPLPF